MPPSIAAAPHSELLVGRHNYVDFIDCNNRNQRAGCWGSWQICEQSRRVEFRKLSVKGRHIDRSYIWAEKAAPVAGWSREIVERCLLLAGLDTSHYVLVLSHSLDSRMFAQGNSSEFAWAHRLWCRGSGERGLGGGQETEQVLNFCKSVGFIYIHTYYTYTYINVYVYSTHTYIYMYIHICIQFTDKLTKLQTWIEPLRVTSSRK